MIEDEDSPAEYEPFVQFVGMYLSAVAIIAAALRLPFVEAVIVSALAVASFIAFYTRTARNMGWVLVAGIALIGTIERADAAPIPENAPQYRAQITREAQFRFGIPAPVPMIAGQIEQESAWRPGARSPVGALGLMQFMPATARWAAAENAWGSVDPMNPAWAIRAGVWYDRWLFVRFPDAHTDCDRWMFALSAYNGGLGWVRKRQLASADPANYAATAGINPGIRPANQRENQDYAPRIVGRSVKYSAWGASPCGRP